MSNEEPTKSTTHRVRKFHVSNIGHISVSFLLAIGIYLEEVIKPILQPNTCQRRTLCVRIWSLGRDQGRANAICPGRQPTRDLTYRRVGIHG